MNIFVQICECKNKGARRIDVRKGEGDLSIVFPRFFHVVCWIPAGSRIEDERIKDENNIRIAYAHYKKTQETKHFKRIRGVQR